MWLPEAGDEDIPVVLGALVYDEAANNHPTLNLFD
jgi:hypothetical protein